MSPQDQAAISAGIDFLSASRRLETLLASKVVAQVALEEMNLQIQSARDTLQAARIAYRTAVAAI